MIVRRRLQPLLVAGAAAAAAGALAASATGLRLSRTVELPDVSLSARLMSTATEAPPAPPKLVGYLVHKDNPQNKIDQYDLRGLWRHRQYAGRWTDDASNVLVLAVMQTPLPDVPADKTVSYDEFAAWSAAATNAAPDWTPELMARWAADFSGVAGVTAAPARERPPRLRDLVEFRFADTAARRLAYAFRLVRASVAQRRVPDAWFFVLVELGPSARLTDAREDLARVFFPNVEASTHGPAPVARAAPGPGAPAATKRSPEFLASREQAIASVRNLKDWWYAETPNYIILSDLKTRNHPLVRQLQADVEALRAEFERFLPPRGTLAAVSVIRLFEDVDEYRRYVDPTRRWTAGLWDPAHRELLVMAPGNVPRAREQMNRVLHHELFHQYVFYALGKAEPAAWFNEGHACFMENAVLKDGRVVEIEEDRDRVEALAPLLRSGAAPLPELFQMTYEQFYAGTDEARESNYALAWALVYYLRRGAAQEKPPRNAAILDRYVTALVETGNAGDATARALADVPPADLARDLRDFWSSSRRRATARRLDGVEGNRPAANKTPGS